MKGRQHFSVAIFEKAECMVNPDPSDHLAHRIPGLTLLMLDLEKCLLSRSHQLICWCIFVESPRIEWGSMKIWFRLCKTYFRFTWKHQGIWSQLKQERKIVRLLVPCLLGPDWFGAWRVQMFLSKPGARFRETSCSILSIHLGPVFVLVSLGASGIYVRLGGSLPAVPNAVGSWKIVQSKWLTWYIAADCTLSIAGWTRFVAGSKALGHKIATVPWIL